MKTKTSWKTIAGLTAAAFAFLRFSKDLPSGGDIIPPATRPDPPQCGRFETAKWDSKAEMWRCVPKGLL